MTNELTIRGQRANVISQGIGNSYEEPSGLFGIASVGSKHAHDPFRVAAAPPPCSYPT